MIKFEKPSRSYYQLIPGRKIENFKTPELIKSINELYQRKLERISCKDKTFVIEPQPIISFKILFMPKEFSFYIGFPSLYQNYFKKKIENTWQHISLNATTFPLINKSFSSLCSLNYKRHNMFSLSTDLRSNDPLSEILSAVRDLSENDSSIVQILFRPYNRLQWETETLETYKNFIHGKMPRKFTFSKREMIYTCSLALNQLINETFNTIKEFISDTDITTKPSFDPEAQLILSRGLYDKTKPNNPVIETYIRIATYSDDTLKAYYINKSLAAAYKEMSADNELEISHLNITKENIFYLQNDLFPRMNISPNLLSIKESAKLILMPSSGLQQQYTQIISNIKEEFTLPDELFLNQIPSIPLCNVSQRGITKTVCIPLDHYILPNYGEVKQKHVYDALCTPILGIGQQGCGKTEGLCNNIVHGFLKNGFSAFVIDTADGQIAKIIEDSLPEDYPDSKIIHLDLDNKEWPVAINFADAVYQKKINYNEKELDFIESSEKLTSILIDCLDSATKTGQLTDRMKQYLSSCALATLRDPAKSYLDVELCLKSPSYRQELIDSHKLDNEPEILQDLLSLQEKTKNNSINQIIDPILNRLKILTSTQTMQNLFYQSTKILNGKPLLNFRHYADNPDGGYGYLVCIHASYDTWQSNQELILSFMQNKILLNVYSRSNIAPDKRKPCLNCIDEPHRFINLSAQLYTNAAVELRKYRMKIVWLGHYLSQLGTAATAIAAGGCQFIQYKTRDLKQFKEIEHVFNPYNAEDLYQQLAEKWEAVNALRLPSGKECPAFIGKMLPPPPFIKSREKRRQECLKIYGQHWQKIRTLIREKRNFYSNKDELWYDENSNNKKERKS